MKIVTRKKANEQVATEMSEKDFVEVTKLSKSLGIEKLGDLQQLYDEQKKDNEGVLDFLRRKTSGAKEEVDEINEAFEDDEFADDNTPLDDAPQSDFSSDDLSQEARSFLAQEGNHIYTEAIRDFESQFDSPSSLAKDEGFRTFLVDNTYFYAENPECEWESGYGTFMGDVDLDDFSKNVTAVHYEVSDSEPDSVIIVADVDLDGSVTVYGNKHYERVYPNDRPDLMLPTFDEETLDARGYAQVRAYLDVNSGETTFDDAAIDELEYE